jgi:predicted DNA-binding ribbon-helix-helix protein
LRNLDRDEKYLLISQGLNTRDFDVSSLIRKLKERRALSLFNSDRRNLSAFMRLVIVTEEHSSDESTKNSTDEETSSSTFVVTRFSTL